jgi:polyphosphate kinase 2 (PPK2 family)
MDYRKELIVEPGRKVQLKDIDPAYHGKHEGREQAQPEIEGYLQRMEKLQELLYADRKHALLVVLQGIDAAGKDGVCWHVVKGMNPQGCSVTGFKQPSPEELAHDFLWRVHQRTPALGHVGVFNRSQRFKQRLDDPARHWKISDADYKERELWDDYTLAYEDMLSKCSTKHAPWYLIPSNHKWFRNLAVSQIICATFDEMKMKMPEPSVNIAAIRKLYHQAAGEQAKRR